MRHSSITFPAITGTAAGSRPRHQSYDRTSLNVFITNENTNTNTNKDTNRKMRNIYENQRVSDVKIQITILILRWSLV